MPVNISRHGQQRPRVGGVCHKLRGIGRLKLAKTHFPGFIHGGVDENDAAGLRNCLCQFRRELMARGHVDSRKVHLPDCGGNLRTDTIVTTQFIAVTDHEQAAIEFRGGIWHRREKLKRNSIECQQEGCCESFQLACLGNLAFCFHVFYHHTSSRHSRR